MIATIVVPTVILVVLAFPQLQHVAVGTAALLHTSLLHCSHGELLCDLVDVSLSLTALHLTLLHSLGACCGVLKLPIAILLLTLLLILGTLLLVLDPQLLIPVLLDPQLLILVLLGPLLLIPVLLAPLVLWDPLLAILHPLWSLLCCWQAGTPGLSLSTIQH